MPRFPTACLAMSLAALFSSSAQAQPAAEPIDPSPEAPTPGPRATPPLPPGPLPWRLPYYADEPVPPGYHVVERPNWAMTGTGIASLGALWIGSIAAAIHLDRAPDGSDDPNFDDNYAPLFVPVVGPFATIATADASGTGAGILALDGVLQLAAATLIVTGLTFPVTELERKETLWTLSPTASRDGGGLTLSGSF